MAQDMNIGAARVYLTVDTVDYVANIQRALNAAVGFGTDAERAFDKSAGGTRRASQRLLDYVADLGKTNTELTRFESLLRKASAGGADQSVLKAAARAWDDYATNVALTRIETESWERQTKRAAGAARELEQAQRSEAAAAREAANARARAYSQERATVERQFDEFGKSPFDIWRMDAQRQFGGAADPLIQQINLLEQLTREADKYAQELSQAKQEASGINTAFDKQYAELQQRRSAAEGLLGIANQPAPQSSEPNYLAEQRRVVAALEQQVLVEQQIEAQAREIHQEWTAINRQIEAVGKSTYDIMRMDAQRQFGGAADPLIQQINLLEQLTREADKYAQELSQAKQEASGINTAFDKQYAELQQRRSAAEGLLGIANQPAPQSSEPNYLAEQRRVVAALEQQVLVEQQIEAQAREIHQEWTAINRQIEAVGKSTYDIMRMDAQRQFGGAADPLIQQINLLEQLTREADKYAQELSQAKQEASGINTAFDKQYAELQQRRSAAEGLLGIANQPAPQSSEPYYLAEQRRIVAALEQQVLVEQQVEAQAREIHQEWTAINRQIEAVGKSTYDIMRMNAQQKYGANAAPLIEQINRWEELNTTMSGNTVNAKQLEQAIRYLPAQFTDIATSLAGGTNPLLVLFQQGGQIFDQFRLSGASVGDTLHTLGSYALRLVHPLTLAAAAVGAVGFAAFSAAKDMDAFTVAAIRTGEISGNAQQLKDFAATLDQIQGVTSGTAMEAVQKIAAQGILIGENFRLASDAAARWSSVTGDSIDQVSQKFADIAKDPLAALESLNQSEHFLTATQRDRIRVLQEQGDIQQAINEATRIYYDVVISRSGQVEQSLSNISLLWRDIKDGTSGALQEFKNYADGMAGRARDLLKYKNLLSAGLPGLFLGTSAALATPKAPVKFPFELDFRTGNALSQTEVKAINFVEEALRGSRTEAEKFSDEVKKLNGNLRNLPTAELAKLGIARSGDQFSGEAYDKLVDSLRPKPKKSSGGTSARSAAREVRYEFDAQLAMLRTQARETEASYSLQEISATKYYETLRKLAIQERDIQLASNNAQIEAIQGKKGSEQELARLRAQNVQVEQQYLQREIDLRTQQAQLTKQYNDEYRQFVYSLQDGTEALRQQMEMEAISLGMSDKQFGRLQARIEIERDRERQLRELDRRVEENANFAEEAERRKAAVIEETNKKLAAQADLYGYIDAATGNWLTGAEKAWQEWLDQVGDVSGKAFNFFSTAFDGLADLTTDFLTGSEANWRDYLNNLARMITRFVVEQQLTKWMQSLKVGGDSGGGGVMGFVGNLFGALLGSGGGNPNTVSYAPGGSFTWNPAVRPFAAGGVPGGLAGYRNQVVSSPTLFPFAAGGVPNWGLMGEAGREAIMPLTRTSNGDLGVRVASGGGGGPVTFNQTFVVQGTPDRMTRGQMMRAAGAETSRAIRRG